MTKVEEAKAALWGQLVDSGEFEEDDAEVLLDNLVDAAREEGAEQMKKRIWAGIKAQTYLFPNDIVPPLPESYGDSLPIAKQLRDSVTDEINGEDVDPTPD